MIARLPKGELEMESSKESVSVQLTEEERNYIYYLFSSRSKKPEKKPEKFIKLFNKKMNTFLKSGS